MLLAKFNAEHYDDYISRLQSQLKTREGDPEFTGYQRPTDNIFSNSKRILAILCDMAGDGANGSVKFCVTYDGKFEVRFNVYDMNLGYIRVEDAGFRLFNGYEKETKFVSSDYDTDTIKEQLKKYMKNYL